LITQLFQHCKQVRTLGKHNSIEVVQNNLWLYILPELSNMPLMTASTLQLLLRGNPNLTHLSLEKSDTAATNASLFLLASNCRNIRTLSLAYCRQITDQALIEVCEGCKGLTELSVANCTRITRTALHFLAANCTKLTILTLESNHITLIWILDM
jgi:hypothetical protein